MLIARSFPAVVLALLIVMALPNRSGAERVLIVIGGLATEVALIRVAAGATAGIADAVLVLVGFALMVTALIGAVKSFSGTAGGGS